MAEPLSDQRDRLRSVTLTVVQFISLPLVLLSVADAIITGERFPVAEWPVGPPHVYEDSDDLFHRCRACRGYERHAVHSAAYWAKERQIALATADEFIAWRKAAEEA